jgi:two-component SAPR family response regulator
MESHFIGLFNSNEEIMWESTSKIISDYNNWLFIADEHPLSYVKTALDITDATVQNGEVVSSADFYLREQVVRAKPVIHAIEQKVNSIVNTENVNLVVFCEMTWAIRTPSGDIYLRELQEAFQKYLLSNNITIVCIYNETILLDEQLMLGLFSHPEIYSENEIKSNPYFLPANIIKKNHLKPRFNYWLSQIDSSRKKSLVQIQNEEHEEKKNYPIEKNLSTKIAQTNEGRWKIRCFGELRIHRENGELIDWNTKAGATKKLKTIFAFLLIKGEKGASGEELADLLWQDANSTEQAMNRLYHAIRYLRVVLNVNQDSGFKTSFITLQGSMYYLRLPFDSWIDLPMFQELCFKGNEHIKENNIEQAKICYESAERLYSGDLFNDIPLKYIENNDNDWCWGKRFWYREMYHKLLYSLASIHRQMGNLSTAIVYCDKALSEDPILEAAHKEKIIALAEAQRFDAIQRQYRIYTESLKKLNLGLPSTEIRELYLNILRKN